jgi:four helix bundle protein
MQSFRAYQVSLTFYRSVVTLRLPSHLKNQLLRAASSITLNLAEGYGKPSRLDQRRFFAIALGSIRECQAILALANIELTSEPGQTLDHVAASVYKLVHASKR